MLTIKSCGAPYAALQSPANLGVRFTEGFVKYIKIITIVTAIFLASLAGAQIVHSEKIVNTYQKCFLSTSTAECSSREITGAEMVSNQWNGNLRYYVLGCILLLGVFNFLDMYEKKSNKALEESDAKNARLN